MTPREEVLSWYRAATQTILSSAPGEDDADAERTAMKDLLQRQAKCLLAIHDATQDSVPHQVNEALLARRLSDLVTISTSKFYAYRYDLLPCQWRQIYADALILTTFRDVLCSLGKSTWLSEDVLDDVVAKLDRAVITAGGAGVLGAAWIESTLQLLERLSDTEQDERPAKKSKRAKHKDTRFSSEEPYGRPLVSPERACPLRKGWSLDRFEKYMNGATSPRPVVFTDLVAGWPALTDHPWKAPAYLLSRTFGGRRLVPVEVGRSYVDAGWGQELVAFKTFLSRYVSAEEARDVGYLAQHNLFSQIPALRNDISTPDLCWSSVPPHPVDPARDKAPLDVPLVNAWFGPARTITPLHTDAYHNLLVQVVGTKYVRLYPPWSKAMRPRGEEEDGVDMSNTSSLDVGVLEGWDEDAQGTSEERQLAKRELEGEECWECVLGEGDTLLIPMGWWHYVRSLSVSFSVSFWWN
ncbi:jumonji domain containing 5 [Metarhizium rileyi]|uniref:Jumonji domain containing 5 n=1 Tax=Metarhizium rileyi (strain RCEF 4871) TaxID=1649241 RepID=A0A167EB51_METRR|nr:jumonji domain containing 5 [Metarhizium rileyi RCEF 4871]